MAIITLTSDFGVQGHYAAVVKGIILSRYQASTIVDVTHEVGSFNIMEAAYILKSTYPAFPDGTVHLISVDPEQGELAAPCVMHMNGHYFIAPNNGLLSLICEGQEHECRSIEHEALVHPDYPHSFRAARIFAPTAAFLASGGEFEELGPEEQLRTLHWGEPSYTENCLRGKIIYIDTYGNAVTNIRKREFIQIKEERSFEIFIRNVRLRRIVNTYSDVAKADALAIFGESNHLEISMREASASELLGLKVHDMITIEFK